CPLKGQCVPPLLLAGTRSLFVRCQFAEEIACHRNQLRMLTQLGHQSKERLKCLLLVHLHFWPRWFPCLPLLARLSLFNLALSRWLRLRAARGELPDLRHHALDSLKQWIAL